MDRRRHDLEALRIGSIGMILPCHAAKFFDHFGHPDSFYVMNDAWCPTPSIWVLGLIHTLPLPFLRSSCGASQCPTCSRSSPWCP